MSGWGEMSQFLRRGGCSLLLCIVGCLVLGSCGKTELKKRTLGYKGEARANAFLAGQRYLRELGYEVESKSGVGRLDDEVMTLFLPTSSLNTSGRGKRVMNWVSEGGHVVVMLENGHKRGNDFIPRNVYSKGFIEDLEKAKVELEKEEESVESDESVDSERSEGGEISAEAEKGEDAEDVEQLPGVEYIFAEVGVELAPWIKGEAEKMERDDWEAMVESERALLNASECVVTFDERELTFYQWDGAVIRYASTEGAADTDAEGDSGEGSEDASDDGSHSSDDGDFHIVSMYYGDGMVTLLGDASPLRNRYIGFADHADFLAAIVDSSPTYDGLVIFSSGSGDSFFSLIWQHFSYAVIGLAVVVVFWLWCYLPRFGPVEDLSEGHMRDFSGQLQGVGRFLWRYKSEEALLAALRSSITRKVGSGGEQGQDKDFFEKLAERSSLPVGAVIEAMSSHGIRDHGTMVRVVRNLQAILQTIN